MRSINWLLLSSVLLAACSTMEPRQEKSADATSAKQLGIERQASDKPDKPLDPELLRSYQQALKAMQTGDSEQAKVKLRQLTLEEPALAGPQINLGILLLAEDDLQGAEAAFRAALQHNPKHAVAYNQLGWLLRRQGRFADAQKAYQSALLSDPDYHLAHRNIGILYDLYLREPSKALQHYQRCQALEEQPDKELAGWIIDLERQLKAEKR